MGPWGHWRSPYYCPPKTYARGFRLQVEGKQGDGDDTALNNLMLLCSKNGGTLQSKGANNWGSWGRNSTCANSSYISAFALRVEGKQGDGDDTAANSFDAMCSNGASLHAENGGPWGRWGNTAYCPGGTVVCGAQLKVEESLGGSKDDTAVNDVKLFCCPLR